jgi:thioredoxin-like negative regulator of GroEL
MESIFDSYASNGRMLVKVDVDRFPEIVQAYNVKGVPHFFGIKDNMIQSEYAGSNVKTLNELFKNL